jgi:tetratricopeptide (TPR) repeat protein
MLWKKSYDMVRKHPVYGVGMGNWQIHFPDATLTGLWRAEDLNFTFQRPHNDLLWILTETGWIGMSLFLIFIFALFLGLLRGSRAAEKDRQLEMFWCVAFIFGFYVASFFDFPKERAEHTIWLNVIFAFAYLNINKTNAVPAIGTFSFKRSYVLVILVLLLCVMRFRGEYYTMKMYTERILKNEANAIRYGNEAVSFAYCVDPTSVPIYWYTANSYANLGSYENAQRDFLLAYRHNPYNRNVLNDLGSSYSFTKNNELAKKYYNEALRISPRFDDPKLNLSAIYIQEKAYRKADTLLRSMFHDSERRTQYQKLVDAFKGSEP